MSEAALLHVSVTGLKEAKNGDGVVDGTRTRNIQNHNLGLYH